MKIFLTLVLLTITLFGAKIDDFAQEMGFERDYKTALAKAQKNHKPLLMVLGADYCPWCRKFEHKTLKSSLVKPKLDKEFIVLLVDKKYDIETFPKQFQTQFTPRVFFINPKNEDILLDTVGYIKKVKFSQEIEKAKKLYEDIK